MVSIKTIADGLSKQIEQAIEGKANVEQADILCKSVDSLVKLARLQIEMASIDWNGSDEQPVIEMERTTKRTVGIGDTSRVPTATALTAPVKKNDDLHTQVKKDNFNQNVQNAGKLNQTDSDQIPIGLGDKLMLWISKRKENFTIAEIAAGTFSVPEVETVKVDIGYWVSKGHLQKIGSGAVAVYKILDRDFFLPKQ